MSTPDVDHKQIPRRSQRKRYLDDRWTGEQRSTASKKTRSSNIISNFGRASKDNSGPLCKQCESLDLEKLLETYVETSKGICIHEIGLVNKEKVWKGCVLCRFWFQLRAEAGYGRTFYLRAFSSYAILTGAKSGGVFNDAAFLVTPEKEAWEREPYGQLLPRVRDYGLIVQQASCPDNEALQAHHIYRGGPITPSRINYSRVQQWLEKCQTLHAKTCGRREIFSLVRVVCIDCYTREVGEIASGEMYLALSYVWGPTSAGQYEQNTEDSSSRLLPTNGVPRIVEDAMQVVRELGLRYLWVDKFCIDQHHSNIRQQQIEAMNYIYEQAYVTLVASSSETAHSGLPGVGSTTRRVQPSLNLQGKRFLSTLPTLPAALKGSLWKTRGWTYQEYALSRRCLFFTDLQVYFVCSAMSCCESIVSGRDDTTFNAAEGGILGMNVFGGTPQGPELRKFAEHLSQYTSRYLTYDSDALNAFRGYLARSKFWTFYGIPIAPTDSSTFSKTRVELDLGFARGLFWFPQHRGGWRFNSLSRRYNFPSWSWAGWKGAVEYPGLYGPAGGADGELICGDRKNCDTTFWAEDHDKNLVTFEKLFSSSQQNRLIVEASFYIHVDAWTFSLWFQPWKGENLIVCDCHLDRAHDGVLGYEHRWEEVILCETAHINTAYYHRLISNLWTCILLFNGVYEDDGHLHNLMVVDWNGNIAHRIGVITLRAPRGHGVASLDRLPGRKRQRIRLE